MAFKAFFQLIFLAVFFFPLFVAHCCFRIIGRMFAGTPCLQKIIFKTSILLFGETESLRKIVWEETFPKSFGKSFGKKSIGKKPSQIFLYVTSVRKPPCSWNKPTVKTCQLFNSDEKATESGVTSIKIAPSTVAECFSRNSRVLNTPTWLRLILVALTFTHLKLITSDFRGKISWWNSWLASFLMHSSQVSS